MSKDAINNLRLLLQSEQKVNQLLGLQLFLEFDFAEDLWSQPYEGCLTFLANKEKIAQEISAPFYPYGSFRCLRTLEVAKANFVGLNSFGLQDIPLGLKHCPALYHIDLSNNHLNNEKDSNFLANLSSLDNIKVLNLNYNQLQQLPSFQDILAGLKILHVSHNQIQGEIKGLNLEELHTLTLNNNKINSWSLDNHLPKLRNLHLQYNQLKKIDISAQKFQKLNILFLNENQLKNEGLPQQMNSPYLTHIHLQNNELSAFPNFLIGKRQIRELNLSYNPLEQVHEDLSQWTNLKILRLNRTKIKTLPDLRDTYINELYLDFTDIEDFEASLQHLPWSIQYIKLKGSKLSKQLNTQDRNYVYNHILNLRREQAELKNRKTYQNRSLKIVW